MYKPLFFQLRTCENGSFVFNKIIYFFSFVAYFDIFFPSLQTLMCKNDFSFFARPSVSMYILNIYAVEQEYRLFFTSGPVTSASK
jgi:hypothetical protein